MKISPASLGISSPASSSKPDSYEYSWSWDLGKQAKVNWNPGEEISSMPWIEGGQGGAAVYVNVIPSSAHTGGWEVKRKPSDDSGGYVEFADVIVGFDDGGGETFISNAACSGDYGYSVGRIPAKAIASGIGGGAVQTPNGEGGNRYLSIVLTYLPGHSTDGNSRQLRMYESDHCRYYRPQYINGIPHWIWDGTPVNHNTTLGGTLSPESTAAGRASHGWNLILDTDRGKIMTLTYDMNTADKFVGDSDIDELKWYEESNIHLRNIGFVMHGFIIGSTVPVITRLPIRTRRGGEGRHSLAAFGPGP